MDGFAYGEPRERLKPKAKAKAEGKVQAFKSVVNKQKGYNYFF